MARHDRELALRQLAATWRDDCAASAKLAQRLTDAFAQAVEKLERSAATYGRLAEANARTMTQHDVRAQALHLRQHRNTGLTKPRLDGRRAT